MPDPRARDASRARPIRAAGVILFRTRADGRREYLLLRNAKHKAWGFPKGHVDPGETIREAALREALEETGFRISRLRLGFAHESRYRVVVNGKRRPKTVVHFLAEVPRGRLRRSDEHDLARWATPRLAARLVRFANLRDALERAERSLGGVGPPRAARGEGARRVARGVEDSQRIAKSSRSDAPCGASPRSPRS